MCNAELIRPFEILLVEDNPGDVELAQEALGSIKIKINLAVVGDGIAAMDFLHKRDGYVNAVRPDLVILDLNLPKKDGRQVLSEIKTDADLKQIPVIILTTSNAERDVMVAYDLHANCYISKPIDLNRYMQIVKSIEGFWLHTAVLPHSNGKRL